MMESIGYQRKKQILLRNSWIRWTQVKYLSNTSLNCWTRMSSWTWHRITTSIIQFSMQPLSKALKLNNKRKFKNYRNSSETRLTDANQPWNQETKIKMKKWKSNRALSTSVSSATSRWWWITSKAIWSCKSWLKFITFILLSMSFTLGILIQSIIRVINWRSALRGHVKLLQKRSSRLPIILSLQNHKWIDSFFNIYKLNTIQDLLMINEKIITINID